MSTALPEDLRTRAAGARVVQGPDIPGRPDQAQFTDACFQDGLADAARGIYDKHSFTSQAATTFEHRCSSWLGFALGKAIDKRHDDLQAARDIAADAEAEFIRVQGRRCQAEEDLAEVERRIEETGAILEDPRDRLHEPLTEMLSSPEPVDKKAVKKSRRFARPAFHSVRRLASWLWRQPWGHHLVWLALVAGEIGLIFGITQRLGDDVRTGQLLALSVSGLAVAIAWLAVPPLMEPRASGARKVLSTIALTLYVVTILALGWLRYLTSRPDVLDLVEDAADSSVEAIVLPWFGDALLYALWTALPLALTATIALLHTHRSPKHSEEPPAVAPAGPASPVAEEAPGQGPADADHDDHDDHELQHRRARLLSHLRGLRIQRKQLQERVIALRAEEARAAGVRENVKLNEAAIDQRTRAHLQSLPQMIGEGFLCYLRGLEQALADPTVTAHLHEATEKYMARYKEAAKAEVDDYLAYLDAHPLVPSAPAGSARPL